MAPKSLSNAQDLEKAFIEWNGLIYGYVFLRVKNRTNAEDITQEVFFNAWRSAHTFNPQKASLKTWLFTIATNAIRKHFNPSNTENLDLGEVENEISIENDDLSQEIDESSLIGIIMEKLKLLSPREQELIILRFKQDLPVKEIAEILKLEYNAAKTAIHRAIKRLTDLCN